MAVRSVMIHYSRPYLSIAWLLLCATSPASSQRHHRCLLCWLELSLSQKLSFAMRFHLGYDVHGVCPLYFTHAHTHTLKRKHTHMHTMHTDTHAQTHTYAHTHSCTQCTQTHMHTHTHMHTMHTDTHAHTHTHAHTLKCKHTH